MGDYPLYVVAGVSRAAMLAGWLRFVGLLAAVLVPVTAGLTYVSLVALRKTRREQAITAALNEAVARRAAAEKGMLESQKLETLAQLTGGVAHDFNNLLAIVSSSLHVHRHLHPELGDERHLQAMARAVQSGTRLTRQLLSFSRKQALRPETDRAAVLAARRRRPAAQHARLAHRDGGRGGRRRLPGQRRRRGARAGADQPGAQRQARDARRRRGCASRARNEGASEDGTTMVVIAVADTGVGIAADVLPRVFEPFFTTRMNEAGSGLGLSQVHGFCAQAGGRARIASEPGQGTTVEMVLPAEQPLAQPPVAPDAADAERAGRAACCWSRTTRTSPSPPPRSCRPPAWR